jgi:hypothetical protein
LGRVRRLAPEPAPDATGEPGIIGPPWPFYPRRESGWYRTSPTTAPREWLQAAGNIVQHQNVSVIPGSTAFTATVTTQLPPGAGQSLEPMLLDNDRIIIDAGLLERTDGGPPLRGLRCSRRSRSCSACSNSCRTSTREACPAP